MRWYVVTMLLLAVLVGSLFQASEQTGMRIWNMFATMGIFLFGLVGSLALTRLQRRTGLEAVERALKALEPEWLITDWSSNPGERPDYLLVGPSGLAVVCVDQTAGNVLAWRARRLIEQSRQRTQAATAWVEAQLAGLSAGQELRVQSILILARRRASSVESRGGVLLLNPEQIGAALLPVDERSPLDPALRIKLTRHIREQALPPTA